jgi:nitrous oxidase accessory protein
MTPRSRVLLAIAAAVLLFARVLPLWRIQLVAPQYPEGLGMEIYASTVRGAKEHDLENINKLNHYIGMRRIEPEAIADLRVIPWFIMGLAGAGVVAALVGRRRVAIAWLAAFAVVGAVGFWDFWRWQHDYGTNLDAEHAIIKVPGMTYEPPLIGTKQLLNFTATSWPAAGSLVLGAGFALGVLAVMRRSGTAPKFSLAFATLGSPSLVQRHIDVTPGPGTPIAAAVARAHAADTIVIHAGRYSEPLIVVDKPLVIVGDRDPVLDGGGRHGLLTIKADDVTVRGLVLANVGTSFVNDRAAIRVDSAHACTIADNRIDNAFFAIYLANTTGCVIRGNTIRGRASRETEAGNGIHLWTSRRVAIAGNRISGHRDGIYFEFVHDGEVRDNMSADNLRYGLHFMYSDDCQYSANVFERNGSGVAVMYSKRVAMTGNRFENNRGAAAYGLLLKEITDARLKRNVFSRNTTALVADGANRLVAEENEFTANGWAVKLDANTEGGRFARNEFVGNSFDVTTNSRSPSTVFVGNHWDAYRGYDLNRDGIGDVPHRPVRLFSLIVEHHPPALILMRGAFVELLDAAERVLPTLTPETVVDASPAMRRLR